MQFVYTYFMWWLLAILVVKFLSCELLVKFVEQLVHYFCCIIRQQHLLIIKKIKKQKIKKINYDFFFFLRKTNNR